MKSILDIKVEKDPFKVKYHNEHMFAKAASSKVKPRKRLLINKQTKEVIRDKNNNPIFVTR